MIFFKKASGLPRAFRLEALSIRNFRIYFLGLAASVAGPWMQTTAQAWLVLKLTDSSLALATVTSLQFLPIMLLALVGGAVADRFPRRRLMLATQIFGAAQALVLGVLVATETVQIWHVYGLAICLGLVNALDAPLRQAFVSELVDLPHIPNAIALVSMTQNLGRIVGPAVGGLALALVGVQTAFFLNAVTFLALILALLLISGSDLQQKTARAVRSGVLGDVGACLSYAIQTRSIMFILIATAFVGMFGQNFTTMIPLVSNFLVHASAAEFGLLNSCLGLGSFLAAFLLTGQGVPTPKRILLAGFGFGAVLMLISFSTNLWLSCALFLLVGGCAVTFSTSINTSLQIQSPIEMRGRFASISHLLITGTSPIGGMLTGLVAQKMSVWASVFCNGLLCCIGMGIALVYLRKVGGGLGADLGRSPDAVTLTKASEALSEAAE